MACIIAETMKVAAPNRVPTLPLVLTLCLSAWVLHGCDRKSETPLDREFQQGLGVLRRWGVSKEALLTESGDGHGPREVPPAETRSPATFLAAGLSEARGAVGSSRARSSGSGSELLRQWGVSPEALLPGRTRWAEDQDDLRPEREQRLEWTIENPLAVVLSAGGSRLQSLVGPDVDCDPDKNRQTYWAIAHCPIVIEDERSFCLRLAVRFPHLDFAGAVVIAVLRTAQPGDLARPFELLSEPADMPNLSLLFCREGGGKNIINNMKLFGSGLKTQDIRGSPRVSSVLRGQCYDLMLGRRDGTAFACLVPRAGTGVSEGFRLNSPASMSWTCGECRLVVSATTRYPSLAVLEFGASAFVRGLHLGADAPTPLHSARAAFARGEFAVAVDFYTRACLLGPADQKALSLSRAELSQTNSLWNEDLDHGLSQWPTCASLLHRWLETRVAHGDFLSIEKKARELQGGASRDVPARAPSFAELFWEIAENAASRRDGR